MDLVKEISANGNNFSADAGEPDTGFSPAGQTRVLGVDDSKPEPWYDKLDFEQVDFPVADYIYGDKAGEKKCGRVVKVSALISEHEEIKKGYKKLRWLNK